METGGGSWWTGSWSNSLSASTDETRFSGPPISIHRIEPFVKGVPIIQHYYQY
jgi:hypothetical protein